MVATEEQLQRAKIPVAYRDYCSHLLIALNDCRLKEYWMPWKCEHERHSYEMCEYDEYVFFFLLARLFLYRTKLTRYIIFTQMEEKKASKEGSKIESYF
jgi:NADH dehydrogenase (ubiquinone) 1 beta subcomplex subunit 7